MLFEYASPSTNSVRPTNCGPTARLRLLHHSHTLCTQVSTTSLQDTPGPPAHPGGTTTNAERMCAMHAQLLWAPAELHACVAHAKKRPNLCMPPARPLGHCVRTMGPCPAESACSTNTKGCCQAVCDSLAHCWWACAPPATPAGPRLST
jgi:hypothetical protein